MSLTIILGNMFSGKTSELIRRLKRYKVIGKRVLVINSQKDTRSQEEVLHTHDLDTYTCLKTNDLVTINFLEADVVAIDEAQFFKGLKDFVQMLLSCEKPVIIAGLNGDYLQRPFGELLECIPLADEILKLSALCMGCMDGTLGPFTKRIVKNDEVELVGDRDIYRAVCRKHLDTTILS